MHGDSEIPCGYTCRDCAGFVTCCKGFTTSAASTQCNAGASFRLSRENELAEALLDALIAANKNPEVLDSAGVPAYAKGILLLSSIGYVVIEEHIPGRVIARRTKKGRP